jgi:hypothetical protein
MADDWIALFFLVFPLSLSLSLSLSRLRYLRDDPPFRVRTSDARFATVVSMALAFPPVCEAFLRLFGPGVTTASVLWDNPSCGTFDIVVGRPPPSTEPAFRWPEVSLPVPEPSVRAVEVETDLRIPVIPPDRRATDPPVCAHGRPTIRRTVSKKDSPNIGRVFFVCAHDGAHRCSFFRWADDLDSFSTVTLRPTLTAAEVARETAGIDPDVQLAAWIGVNQGSEEWHRLRACRVTASNFGSVNHTNSFAGPADLLRSILWPQSMDSVAMKYGSFNEAVAFARFSEYLTEHAERTDLPIYVDSPGIWISKAFPFLGGSPDGVVYETLEAHPMGDDGAVYYRCRRSLLETAFDRSRP